MKLTLFSQNLTEVHKQKIRTFFDKPLEEVKFLYINTPGNYKPYKSKWMMLGEQRWKEMFTQFQEFDIERAVRVDPNFNFEEFYKSYDYIFVSGGNSFVLTYWMHKTGSDKILRNLISNGKVYGGESAGAIYAFSDLDLYKKADQPEKALEKIDEGLGLINFAPIPHWGNSDFQLALEAIKKEFEIKKIKTQAISDDQAIFIEDGKIEIL